MVGIASLDGVGAYGKSEKDVFENPEIVMPTYFVVLSAQTSLRSNLYLFFLSVRVIGPILGWNLIANITATSPYPAPLNKSWPLFVKEVKGDLLRW